jgi:hypothetical protein
VDLLPIIQAHVARVAITPSAARRQGAAGVVAAARSHLAQMPLTPFGAPSRFVERLDQATLTLQRSLPGPAQSWGLSRKLLNLFLRDALYTKYLSETHKLESVEHLLEVPLDSITAGALRKRAGRGQLPRWISVKALDPKASAAFQEFALSEAERLAVSRVHLDAILWARPGELNPTIRPS